MKDNDMERELKDIIKEIQEYRMELEAELKGTDDIVGLETQIAELKAKLDEKGSLSRKERKNFKKASARIKEIKAYFAKCEELIKYEQAQISLKDLTSTLPKLDKQSKIDTLVNLLKDINVEEKQDLAEKLGCEEKNLDVEKAKKDVETKIADLESDKTVLEKRKLDTTSIEEEINDQKALLDTIENYLKNHLDENQIRKDLKDLSNSKTKKALKEEIYNKYQELIEGLEKEIALELAEFAEVDKAKKAKKAEIKEKSKKLGEWLKEHKKTIIKVAGTAVLVVGIIAIAKSCENEIENTKPEDTKKPTGSTSTEGTENREIINTLIGMGYDELTATRYAHTPGFILDYLGNYEDAINGGIIEIEKAVDYVNRAYKIQATRFFDDASILDIVKIIDEINKQENRTIELTSIIGTLNDIYNNYQYQTLTQEDANKLDALLYFANDDSDLDNFLTEYALIAKQVLNAKNDAETSEKAKNDMYNYLNVFANTYAGYIVEGEFTNPNSNAVVEDSNDWAIAYASFVRPLMSMNITPENAEAFGCLQINMLSNYEQWAQVNGCDHTLTLGKQGE